MSQQNRPSAMTSPVPPHLTQVLEAVAGLDPFEDSAPEALRAGRLRELRRHLAQTAITTLQDRPTGGDAWTDAEVAARGLGYVAAVGRYIRSVSASFPVDPYLVAMNAHLLPVLRAGCGPVKAVEGNPLAFRGVLYADPASLLLAEAHPATVATVTTADGCVPFAAFSRAHSAKFVWPAAAFPVLSARLADGTLLIPRAAAGGLEWIVVQGGEAPAGATVSAPTLSAPVLGGPPAEGPPFAEQASSLKGARGEARVYEVLTQRTAYAVRDVSHRARSADMVAETPAGKIYVESKDYNIAVPDREVQKFRRDLGARGAVAGVLVSLSSGIVGVRGALSASLEALPAEGRIVPVVYVASGHPDVIAAGADLAAYLAKVHPGTLAPAGLHTRDALEAYASGLEDVADLFEDVRAELARLATATAAGLGGSLEKLGLALRDHRRIVRAQRAAAEEAVEGHALLTLEEPALWAEFAARYAGSPAVQEGAALQGVLRALGAARLGDIREAARWRFLKTKAVHVSTGTAVSFLKTRTELVRPLALVTLERVGSLLARHPKKVRIADGALALELDDSTAADALELV